MVRKVRDDEQKHADSNTLGAVMDQLCFFEHDDLGAGHGKVCSKCNQYLPLDAFNMASGGNYLRAECRKCNNEMQKVRQPSGRNTGCRRRATTALSAKALRRT